MGFARCSEKNYLSISSRFQRTQAMRILSMSSSYLDELMPQICPLMQVLGHGLCLVNPPEGHKIEGAAENTPG